MARKRYIGRQNGFDADHIIFWSNLSRLINLMAVMNISMFYLMKGRIHPVTMKRGVLKPLWFAWAQSKGCSLNECKYL